MFNQGRQSALGVAWLGFVMCGRLAAAQTAEPTPGPSAPRTWQVSFDGQHGELSGGQADQGEYTFTLAKAINRRVKFTSALDQYDRFEEIDTQLALGTAIGLVRRRSLVTLTYSEGFGAEMASRHQFDGKFSFQTGTHVRPEGEYEYARYIEGQFLSKVTAGLALLPTTKLQGELTLVVSSASGGKGGAAGQFGVSYAINDRVTVKGGGGYGHEHFLAKSLTEVKRELTALGLTGQVDWSLPHHSSVNAGWQYADRKKAYKTNTVTFGWAKSF